MGLGRPEAPAVGTTVTLRVETPVGAIGVVGVLVAADETTWTVRRRDGSETTVEVARISASRVVPPGRSQRASVAEVAGMAALGWRALETARLGDWLLRASGGFTRRANSVLALGEAGTPVADALDVAAGWYAERGLPCRVQLFSRDGPDGLADVLDARGWSSEAATHVMTAELGHVLRAADGVTGGGAAGGVELRLDAAPDDGWLGCYRQAGGSLPAVAADVLSNHPAVVFASLRDGDRVLAIARGVVDDRWAGLYAVEVTAGARRRGLATTVTAATLRWCAEHGGRRTYLQVEADNGAAVSLYERLGYVTHHDYIYRTAPPPA